VRRRADAPAHKGTDMSGSDFSACITVVKLNHEQEKTHG